MTGFIEKLRGFPRAFWSANLAELLERAAFYGMFISLALYLTRIVGFTDVEAGWVAAVFSSVLYFAPTFAGAAADAMGFRRALLLAFGSLAIGYGMMGVVHTKVTTIVALTFVLVGGGFVKSVITGTVAKTSSEENRALAFSIFYQLVNIGAFSGKALAKPIRTGLGLSAINYASAGFAILAFLLVLLFYQAPETEASDTRTFSDIGRNLAKVVTNVRFMTLIVIVGGFWAIQHQLYATMPKYVLRMVGEHAAPEWYANVNPLVVVLFVVPVTHLVRKLRPVTSIGIALLIIPMSAFTMSLSSSLEGVLGRSISILPGVAVHPITIAMIGGIALQAVAECFLSPRFLEYASHQAPPGEEGLYMGYSHLTSFFGNLLGFGISGYLLDAWCPNPSTLPPAMRAAHEAALAGKGPMPEVYQHSHYIWYVFVGIGLTAFVALMIFRFVTDSNDARGESQT